MISVRLPTLINLPVCFKARETSTFQAKEAVFIRKNKITLVGMNDSTQAPQYTTVCTITEAFKQFIQAARNQNLRPRTIEEHQNHFRYFSQYLYVSKPHIQRISQLTVTDITDYLTYMREKTVWSNHPMLKGVRPTQELSAFTINTRLRTLRRQLAWWHENEFISTNLAKGVKLLKIDENQKSLLNDDDVKRLLAVPPRDVKYSGLRDYVMVLLLSDLGLRITQLVNIKTSDVHLYKREIYFLAETTKSRHDVVKGFSPKCKVWIEQLIKQNEILGFKNGYLFNSTNGDSMSADAFRKALRRYKEKAGITKRISPHKFRSYFAESYLEDGGDMNTLQVQLDHKDIRTTKRYVSTSPESVKKAHLKFSPINRILE